MNEPSSSNVIPRAFVAAPDPNRYFPAAVMEEARQKISRSIERGEGPALVVGAAGTGKTLLLEVLAEQFRNQRVIVPLPGAQLCSRRALMQMILFQVGLPFRGLDEGELRVSLLSYLRPHDGPARRLLLLVDEADSLPARLLEELRVLTNVADQGQLLVSLILAGSATLEERFAEPKMEVLSQRISTRCYLSALGREESFQYVRAQVAAVGQKPDELFAQDGLEAMFAATDGVPRLLNQLGDQLMWMAQETGYSPLDGNIVQQAWSELQQLPAPWNSTPPAASGPIVEFGELTADEDPLESVFAEEADDDLPASIPISTTYRNDAPRAESSYVETFDATDQLLEQLHDMDANGMGPSVPDAVEPTMSQNPFEESFESEEVVFDRYVEFETQLLATAQRVVNRVDTVFAQQLSHCEVIESPVIASCSEEVSLPPTVSPTQVSETVATIQDEQSVVSVEVADPGHVDPASIPVSNEPGELLVVEDEGRPEVAIVPGKQFRHLFSSLESGSGISRLG